MERIVVGMDGSAPSIDALNWAVELARATGAELVAVNAHRPGQSEMRPGYLERLRERRAADLASWSAPAPADVDIAREVIDGDPRDVIPAACERLGADLLVVASSGENSRGPGFLHVGSVVEYLAHHLDRPMAVIVPGAAPRVTRIVTGIDGSAHGRTSIGWTAHLAAATGASVTAVAVASPREPLASPGVSEDWRVAAEHTLATEWAGPLTALGDRLRSVVTDTTPAADAIVRVAADERADLIVVGARGRGGFSGLRIGGTALGVLHRSTRPVVLVPADRRDL